MLFEFFMYIILLHERVPLMRGFVVVVRFVLMKCCVLAQESLEARVLELERALEAEQKNGQRERLALTRLQRQLARVSVEYFRILCASR